MPPGGEIHNLESLPRPLVCVSAKTTVPSVQPEAIDLARTMKRDISNTNLYTATINKGKPSSEDVFLEFDKPIGKEIAELVTNQMKKEGIYKER
jgi:hypothetical protein